MTRALTFVLVVSIAAAPCSFGATSYLDSERSRAGLKMLGDDQPQTHDGGRGLQLRELAARAEAAQAASGATGGGGHKKKTLIIVGASVVVAVLLFAAIRESCKKQGAECLKKK